MKNDVALMSHAEFTVMVDNTDLQFRAFVNSVSPKNPSGVQPVFLAELFLVLKILWEIYQWMKGKGWFSKWLLARKVRAAMTPVRVEDKEDALKTILVSLG